VSGGEPALSGPKIYVSRAVSGSRKNERSRAKRGAGGRGAVSEDHRNRL